ncbi:hypothetical protein BO98_00995 [Candidatus Synechococcus spongiarum LMB bulk10D]|nr:hypothetical protein BO98_00995 [Candidatus Synechococcus spongiarum LMB bulk10D]
MQRRWWCALIFTLDDPSVDAERWITSFFQVVSDGAAFEPPFAAKGLAALLRLGHNIGMDHHDLGFWQSTKPL